MNVPQLRFSGFDGEWEQQELGELLEFKNGINADKDSYGYGTKFINVLDILNNDYILSDKIIGSVNASQKQLETYSVTYGDILFLRSSETREDVGICNVYLDDETPAVFGGFVIRGKKIADYSPFFLKAVLNNSSARNQISSKAGGSTRYNVGQSILSEVNVRVPEIKEQQKISSFFMLLNQKTEKQQEKIKKLEQFKKGMMQKIFSQELRFKDEDGGEFSEWEIKTINELAECLDNQRKPLNSSDRQVMKGDVPYYGANGIVDYIDQYLFEEELILLAEDGGQFDEFADRPIAQYISGKSWVNNHAHILKAINCNNKMLFYLLVHKDIRKYINGTSRAKLNKESMLQIEINIPRSLEEQIKIVDYLSALDSKLVKEKEKLMALEEQKKGFMQGMFV